MRTYSDSDLTRAVASARSWRGVLRSLGLSGTSAGSMRSVRGHADRLGLDTSHFTGRRRWSEADLARAVAEVTTWSEVVASLGLGPGSSNSVVRSHALRLGIHTQHLDPCPPAAPSTYADHTPDASNLARAGSMLAASWFQLSGVAVSWPLEPTRYDLLAWRGAKADRIQVKTTTRRDGGTWRVSLCTNHKAVRVYTADEIDYFFVINRVLDYYLIPLAAVGGLKEVSLSGYASYRLPRLALPPG